MRTNSIERTTPSTGPSTRSAHRRSRRLTTRAAAVLAGSAALTLNFGISSAGAADTRAYTTPLYYGGGYISLGYGKFSSLGGDRVKLSACDTYADGQRIVVNFGNYFDFRPNTLAIAVDAGGANNGCGDNYTSVPFPISKMAAVACRQDGGSASTQNHCGKLTRLAPS